MPIDARVAMILESAHYPIDIKGSGAHLAVRRYHRDEEFKRELTDFFLLVLPENRSTLGPFEVWSETKGERPLEAIVRLEEDHERIWRSFENRATNILELFVVV